MKRLLLLLTLFAGAATFQSCDGDTGPQGPAGPDSIVYELRQVDFNLFNGEYQIYRTFGESLGFNLYDSETVLVYRQSSSFVNNAGVTTPIWQLIPRTLFLPQGELDYDFDFSQEDFTIYAGGNFDPSTTPEYINDQTFRLVIIPGSFQNRNANNAGVDFNDYNAVIKKYGINDKNVKVIK